MSITTRAIAPEIPAKKERREVVNWFWSDLKGMQPRAVLMPLPLLQVGSIVAAKTGETDCR